MRILVALVALAVVVTAVVAVAFRESGTSTRSGSVTLVGDSLNVGIEPYLPDALPGWTIERDDEVGRATAAGVEALRGFENRLAPTVVISLGTNDPVGSAEPFRELVAEALAVAGSQRCVVWLTIFGGAPRDDLNQVLRAAAGENGNVKLVEWAAMVEDEPALLAADGVHGTDEGYRRRAEAVAAAVRDCAPDA